MDAPAGRTTDTDVGARLDRLLHATVLPWWRPICSAPDGGFRPAHDVRGQPVADRPIALVAQARVVWAAATLAGRGIDPGFWGPVARRGVGFLLDRFADPAHGGFVWLLAADGRSVAIGDKHLYGQAFALLALVETARLFADAGIAAAAHGLWQTIQERSRDRQHGGHLEWFAPDWRVPPPGGRSPLGVPDGVKLLNTHMHLMEAARSYAAWSGAPAAREWLAELVLVCAVAVQNRDPAFPTDRHAADWRPLGGVAAPASYGHAAELAWLLPRAAQAAGVPAAVLRGLCDDMVAAAIRFGLDARQGGLFEAGPLGGAATRHHKIWWVQAEGLVAFLDRFAASADPAFAHAFRATLDWIERRQVDRIGGEWHAVVQPDGRLRGDKASGWKCPYHQVRALLHCRDLVAAGVDAARPA
ncbi:AGE family epimerase/isomerase [Stella sp.]|uniref:AGE family epimerase/isomerase n=1 Tax=Stella sp. TaxID=2912054 RepID=UPI0035AE0B2D